jgi:cysteine-rich repeat protein
MTHTSSPSFSQYITAAVLTFVVTATTGYSAGTAYVGASSGETLSALLSAPVVRSASSVSSRRKVMRRKKVNRALIVKPRTRTSTGSSSAIATSKAPSVPIKASCGDKLIISNLGEDCDDGNTASGDGCSSVCKLEAGFTCTGMPTTCVARCGDGIVTSLEKCDDGNIEGGDGCSGICKIELSYVCKNSPSFCELIPYCGDGIKASTEACDDGNSEHGDGCYACKAE